MTGGVLLPKGEIFTQILTKSFKVVEGVFIAFLIQQIVKQQQICIHLQAELNRETSEESNFVQSQLHQVVRRSIFSLLID